MIKFSLPFLVAMMQGTPFFGEPGYARTILFIMLLTAFTVIIPLWLGWLSWKRLERGLQYFLVLLAFVLVTETTAFALGAFNIRNIYVFNVFTGVEYTFLILMFAAWLSSHRLKRIILWSIPVFVLIWTAVNFGFGVSDEALNTVYTVFLSVESVLFVLLSVLTLVMEMRDSSVLLVDNPRFWVASGILVYFAGNIFVFNLMGPIIARTDISPHHIYLIHSMLNVTKNVLFSLGFIATGGPREALAPRWRRFRRKPKV